MNRTLSHLNPQNFYIEKFLYQCFLTKVLLSMTILHSLELPYVLQDVYQLPTHKISACDTEKIYFIPQSLNA